MKFSLPTLLLLLSAACSPVSDPAAAGPTSLATQPSEETDPCAADVTTEVAAAEVPFDLSAVAARSGTRGASGAWADGGSTEVAVTVDVRTDAAFRITPEDPSCSVGERWRVEVEVSVSTADSELATTWTEQTPAEVTAPWSLGTVLGEEEAAALRSAAGYTDSTDPYASISLTWDDGVDGAVLTHEESDEADTDQVVLAFE